VIAGIQVMSAAQCINVLISAQCAVIRRLGNIRVRSDRTQCMP